MDYYTKEFEQMLQYYKMLQENYNIELRNCLDGKLNCTNRNKHKNYFHAYSENGRSKRKGITNNEYAIRNLARKEYLTQINSIIDNNIKILNYAMTHYKTIDPVKIVEELTSTYHGLPINFFLEEDNNDDDWSNAEFDQSTYNIWEKDKIASSGLRVRSKSELFIVEKLLLYGIPFRYEQMLYIENKAFSPDFTIKTKHGLIYWEHLGMMHIPDYKSKNKWKLSMYEKANIVPWNNLIITYDTEDGGINLAIIDAEIKNRILVVFD